VDTSKKLETWQQRLSESDRAYSAEADKMNERERLYNGYSALRPLAPGDTAKDGEPRRTGHVRNIVLWIGGISCIFRPIPMYSSFR